ncbi:PRE C2HC domain containing protein, partial [Asbolus verrucosus]
MEEADASVQAFLRRFEEGILSAIESRFSALERRLEARLARLEQRSPPASPNASPPAGPPASPPANPTESYQTETGVSDNATSPSCPVEDMETETPGNQQVAGSGKRPRGSLKSQAPRSFVSENRFSALSDADDSDSDNSGNSSASVSSVKTARKSKTARRDREKFPPLPAVKTASQVCSPPPPSTSAPHVAPTGSTPPQVASQKPKAGQVPAAPPSAKVPPIIVREKSRWTEISKACAEPNSRVNFSKAKPCVDGIRVQPVTAEDFRKLMRLLNSRNIQYHSFTLPEEKSIRVVLRQVPVEIDSREVLEDLKVQGFHPILVTRMQHPRKKENMPLVHVEVPGDERHIWKLRSVCDLLVEVESPNKPGKATQCFRCQRFNHSQRN